MSLPKGPISLRIHALYRRRPGTHWDPKEVKALKALVKQGVFATPAAMADLELVERFYAAQRARGSEGIHRRELLTFLNRYRGEVDKARDWEDRSKPRRPRAAKQASSRTDATGANIMTEVDPTTFAEPQPISEEVQRFADQFEQRTGRKLMGT